MDRQQALNPAPVATNSAIEMDDIQIYQRHQSNEPFLNQSTLVNRKKNTVIAVTIIVIVLVVLAAVIATKVIDNKDDDSDFPKPQIPDYQWPDIAPEDPEWPEHNYPDGPGGGCNMYNTTIHPQNYICGKDEMSSANGTIPATKCPDICQGIYGYHNHIDVLYNKDTQQCYCSQSSWYYAHQDDPDCFNVSAAEGDFMMWSQDCWAEGRPYNLEDESNLIANVEYIDCDDYIHYDDDQWKEIMSGGISREADLEMASQWIEQGLQEHASIGTFAKFTIELMSIGAPLWMIELANTAGADEIRHAQISFDIANAYLDGNHGSYGAQCAIPGEFPQHQVHVDGDWNRIAVDTAIGGCIGETVSAFKMLQRSNGSIFDGIVKQIAMDEVRHAALAWTVVDWMIENHESRDLHLDVANKGWWASQSTEKGMDFDVGSVIYDEMIHSIFGEIKVWDHQLLYSEVVELLTSLILNASSLQDCKG